MREWSIGSDQTSSDLQVQCGQYEGVSLASEENPANL